MNRRAWGLIFIAALVLLTGVGAGTPQQRSVTYRRYDVDIAIQPDGTFFVTEKYDIAFEGTFHSGFAEIPLTHVTAIKGVQVREGETNYAPGGSGPGTFIVEQEGDTLYVDWEFIPTSGSEERTFYVSYLVEGGLSVYPDGVWLAWKAVPPDRSGIRVENSRVTVHLPQPVASGDLQLDTSGPQVAVSRPDGQTVVFDAQQSLPDGMPFIVVVGMPPGTVNAVAPEWQRELDEARLEYRLEALDVDLTLAPDGSLAVTESQRVAVDQGVLYHGYREIPLFMFDRLEGISLREDGHIFLPSESPCDYCYVVERKRGGDWVEVRGTTLKLDKEQAPVVLVEWAFPAIVEGQVITFDLSYTALGAVRVLTDRQEINWTVVFADRDVPVEQANLRLHLPPSLAPDEVTVVGEETAVLPDGSLAITHAGPIPAGEEWAVTLRLPPDALTAEKPDWQRRLESALAEQQANRRAQREMEIRRARWQLALGVVGVLLPLLGLAGMLLAWYIWGRDYPIVSKTYAVREPPSDLPPGIVAYLVDERPTVKGVLGDLFRLATLGLISIDLREYDFTITLNWGEKVEPGHEIQMDDGLTVRLAPHEATLFNTLLQVIREPGRPLAFSDSFPVLTRRPLGREYASIREAFVAVLPTVYEQMGEVATRYFSSVPDRVRKAWLWNGQRIVIAAGMLAIAMTCFLSSLGPVVYAPPVGLALVGLLMMLFSRWMPKRTPLGAVEAAKWRAFRRYLVGLKRYGDLETAQKVLDRYFPYAIALGVEEVVLKQAGEMGARMPVWTVPAQVMPRAEAEGREREEEEEGHLPILVVRSRQWGGTRPKGESVPAGARPKPLPALAEHRAAPEISLEKVSDGLARSLNRASESLSDLLNTAVGSVEQSPFEAVISGAGDVARVTWDITSGVGSTTLEVLGDILEAASSGGGSGGYSGSSSSGYRSSSWRSSSSSSWKPSRSSGSFRSRSGGGGRRGFR